jgi:uncharacterized protein (DUF433 family)
MVTKAEHLYVVRNTEILSGEPIIAGTRTPVRAIVEMWRIGRQRAYLTLRPGSGKPT